MAWPANAQGRPLFSHRVFASATTASQKECFVQAVPEPAQSIRLNGSALSRGHDERPGNGSRESVSR